MKFAKPLLVLACGILLVALFSQRGTLVAQKPPADRAGDDRDESLKRALVLKTEADNHKTAGSWARAIDLYQRVLRDFPEFIEARFSLGECYALIRNNDKALEEFLRVANAENATREVAQDAAYRAESLPVPALSTDLDDLHVQAKAMLEKALDNKTKGGALAIGIEYHRLLRESIKRLERLVSEAPTYVLLRLELGLAYELDGQDEAAADSLQVYLKRYANLGLPYNSRQNDVRERLQTLRPESWTLVGVQQAERLYRDAVTQEQFGRYDVAIRLLTTVLKHYPNNYLARQELAWCYRAKEEFGRAIEQLQFVVAGKQVPKSVVEAACAQVIELSSPTQTKEQEAEFNEANALLEAGSKMVREYYSYAQPGDAMSAGGAKIEAAMEKLKSLASQLPNHPMFQVKLGTAAGELTFTAPSRGMNSNYEARPEHQYRAVARGAFCRFLDLYGSLKLPECDLVRDVRARLASVTSDEGTVERAIADLWTSNGQSWPRIRVLGAQKLAVDRIIKELIDLEERLARGNESVAVTEGLQDEQAKWLRILCEAGKADAFPAVGVAERILKAQYKYTRAGDAAKKLLELFVEPVPAQPPHLIKDGVDLGPVPGWRCGTKWPVPAVEPAPAVQPAQSSTPPRTAGRSMPPGLRGGRP
jgi:tetratricopeptide (TPR) repeat protein